MVPLPRIRGPEAAIPYKIPAILPRILWEMRIVLWRVCRRYGRNKGPPSACSPNLRRSAEIGGRVCVGGTASYDVERPPGLEGLGNCCATGEVSNATKPSSENSARKAATTEGCSCNAAAPRGERRRSVAGPVSGSQPSRVRRQGISGEAARSLPASQAASDRVGPSAGLREGPHQGMATAIAAPNQWIVLMQPAECRKCMRQGKSMPCAGMTR